MKRSTMAMIGLLGVLAVPPALAANAAGGNGGGGGGGGGAIVEVGGFPTPTTTTGTCSLDPQAAYPIIETPTSHEFDVDLIHVDLPGGAKVHVVRDKASGTVYVTNVCLEDGWGLLKYKPDGSWSSKGGFELTVSYLGQPAIRYRHVSGGLRWTYFPVTV